MWRFSNFFALQTLFCIANAFGEHLPLAALTFIYMPQLCFVARAPFGPGGPVAEGIEPYLCTTSDSRPGPGGAEPRQAVGIRPEGHLLYRFATASFFICMPQSTRALGQGEAESRLSAQGLQARRYHFAPAARVLLASDYQATGKEFDLAPECDCSPPRRACHHV